MPTNSSVSGKNSGNNQNTTTQSQLAHKRWYPPLPSDTHQDVQNAHRFAFDNLYQLRGWTRQLAFASGVALDGDSATANVTAGTSSRSASASNTISPATGKASSGPSFTSGSQTGPSNSQIMGLNVAATPPQDGGQLTYNASAGQWEQQTIADTISENNLVTWTTILPAHSSDTGTPGTIAFNGTDGHLYVCVDVNHWQRIGIVDF